MLMATNVFLRKYIEITAKKTKTNNDRIHIFPDVLKWLFRVFEQKAFEKEK